MEKYCAACGAQMAENESFCAVCGTKFGAEQRKPLTAEVIKRDLQLQKSSKGGYVFDIVCLLFTLVMSIFGHPIALALVALVAYSLIKRALHDSRIEKLRYTVAERDCVDLRYLPDSEGSDEWKLDFKDVNNVRTQSIKVNESFYNATKQGDVFYVVFLGEEKAPCLCYRKSEWVI